MKEEMNENSKTYVWKENREKSERQINEIFRHFQNKNFKFVKEKFHRISPP